MKSKNNVGKVIPPESCRLPAQQSNRDRSANAEEILILD